MSRLRFLSTPDESQLAKHVNELRKELRGADLAALASLTGSQYEDINPESGDFYLSVWGEDVKLSLPEFVAVDRESGAELPTVTQALLAYYFHTADGASPAGRWISFSELPNGRFYSQAYQGYSGQVIARTFKDDVDELAQVAEKLPRAELPYTEPQLETNIGDRSFSFQALPRVPLLLVYWQGDEDFASTYQVLFEASVIHYLPTDVCAILGSTLTRKLVAGKGA